MKRLSSIILCAVLVFGLTACSRSEQSHTESITTSTASTATQNSEPASSDEEPIKTTVETVKTDTTEPSDITDSESDEKKLVVYFTWSSNTKKMAETIADLTEGDILEIVPAKPYPEDYTACTEVALEERDTNARPEILNLPESVSEYDNIIIGYPIWWHTAPMIIGTFLENYELSEIDVYPFSQSGSMDKEQFAESMNFVRETASGSYVHDGLFAKPSDTQAITEYLELNGLIK